MTQDVWNIYSAAIESHALVYRIEKDHLEGPFTIMNMIVMMIIYLALKIPLSFDQLW